MVNESKAKGRNNYSINEAMTREYTGNVNETLHDVGFKKIALVYIK